MSNQDRIRNWRERRTARHADGETANAAPGLPGARVDWRASDEVGDVLTGVLDALASAPRESVAGRRRIYDALESELDAELARDGAPPERADFRRRQLRMVARLLETDIRAGMDVLTAGYAPATLSADNARLLDGLERRAQQRRQQEAREARQLASREDVAFEIALQPQEAREVALLRERLAAIHARQHGVQPGTLQSRLASILPLLRIQLHILQNESRIALLWSVVGPAVLLSLISSLYFLMGTHYVLGMDVPTFSLLGATTWIMFRQAVFRTSTSYVSARGLINLEPVTPLAVALVQGSLFIAIYLGVYAILISGGHALGLITLPVRWSGAIVYVVMMGVAGVSMGLIFGCIAIRWHFFLRFAPVIERGLELFSSVFFVSEQVPEAYRKYFLWSPFAHGMQLLRSSYFDSYTSHDASLTYFVTALVFLGVLGVAMERLARPHVQPM
ncbi:ABC transporter permease [Paraburkholderia susongensis]|uniref:ABC-type polysaccharide/polyol phosphate export permease n=1 Tax=Paraburkholderia susongensis TaxID=1515439 RepID=A0A1X7I3A3_9BURK|nr:ABC transporter permease [Paraburkholderia susongensis]SMG08950.1 ABC-type polysaccharide/polyol phosphate export permease [Paraburkholderia susongensis]